MRQQSGCVLAEGHRKNDVPYAHAGKIIRTNLNVYTLILLRCSEGDVRKKILNKVA